MSGVVAPTEGEILVDGDPLPTGEPSESLARGVATIYQELDLVEDLTVAESVFLGHEPRRAGLLDRARMRREATELLTRLDHGDIPPDAHVRTLRPAAQQVVSIARALSHRVRLLIMDEPSAILDDQEIEVLFGVVRRLAADGVGVIYISHRLDEISRIGDRVTVLVDGKTVATGLPADTPPAELVLKMVGRRVEQLFPDRAAAVEDVVLDVREHQPAARRASDQLPGPRGRGAGHRRADRRRAHGAAPADLRPRHPGDRRGLGRRQAPAARPDLRRDRRGASGWRRRIASPRGCCSAGTSRRT